MHQTRPRLTLLILACAVVDLFGLACIGIGASWFATGRGAILADFPTSIAEATACTAGGIAVTLWAAARIRRKIAEQGKTTPAAGDTKPPGDTGRQAGTPPN